MVGSEWWKGVNTKMKHLLAYMGSDRSYNPFPLRCLQLLFSRIISQLEFEEFMTNNAVFTPNPTCNQA